MEKLKKLLDEYEGQDDWYIEYLHTRDSDIPQMCCNYIEESHLIIDSYIISKQFGFIKRLVKNDKIDFEKNKLQVLKDIDVRGEVMYDYTLFDKADGVIMLLAISDNPIDLLCERLK